MRDLISFVPKRGSVLAALRRRMRRLYEMKKDAGILTSFSRQTTRFRSTPAPSTSTSTTSPRFSSPTPSGVPVEMMSPG